MSQAPESFKFQYVRDGDTLGLFTKKGAVEANGLRLKDDLLSFDDIADTTTRDNRLIISLYPGARLSSSIELAAEGVVVLEVHKMKAIDLERVVDRHCSLRMSQRNKQRLVEEGKGELFRAQVCPECKAVVDTSELDETAYVYCRYCESVLQGKKVVTRGTQYRTCDECNLFSRVKGYTEFYFYFLLVVYGFSLKKRHLCDNCVVPVFWKTFFANLIFILGVPSSIYMLIKSMAGRDPALKELNKANALVKKGRAQEAAPIFARLHKSYSGHPGLHTNEALGQLIAQDGEGAGKSLEKAMTSCSNYLPAIQLINAVVGDPEQAAG